MAEPIAYLNGEWVPFSRARLSVADYGVVQAATVTEMIRTFGHRPFRVAEHLERLRNSLATTGIADPSLLEPLTQVVGRVADENSQLIDAGDDLGVSVFVTAGINAMYTGESAHSPTPTVCVHSFPLPFARWASQYDRGLPLVIPSVRAIPKETIDPRIKYRSRLHWFLADREAQASDPHAMAVLLDRDDHLTETSSGNLIVYDGRRLRMPCEPCVLGGISQNVVLELAEARGIVRCQENLDVADLLGATEAFISSTTYCLLPIVRVNGQPVGAGVPGPLYRQLIDDWSRRVGVDIITQAKQQSSARTT